MTAARKPPFRPSPDDTIELFGEALAFRQHPAANFRITFSQEGGRATVYEVRNGHGRCYALKVFRPAFRTPDLATSGARLQPLRRLEGMEAADRRVVLPDDAAVLRFPDLEYSLLMPWVQGETWAEVMIRAADHGTPLPTDFALHLCARFLKVVRGLEQQGASHTDVACGNVVVHLDRPAVELLDLEDMFLPGAPLPPNPRPGSPGYQHRAAEPVFCPAGDRYAAAVLAAEILALSNPAFTRLGSDAGLFGTHAGDPEGARRFAQVLPWLREQAPAFAEVFERAWHSPSLRDCPTVAELHDAVGRTALLTPLSAASARAKPVPPPPSRSGVRWTGNSSGTPPGNGAPSTPPRPRAVAPAPNKPQVVTFGTAAAPSPRPPAPTPTAGPVAGPPGAAARVKPREIPAWLLLVLAAVLAFLLLAIMGFAPAPDARPRAHLAGDGARAAEHPGAATRPG